MATYTVPKQTIDGPDRQKMVPGLYAWEIVNTETRPYGQGTALRVSFKATEALEGQEGPLWTINKDFAFEHPNPQVTEIARNDMVALLVALGIATASQIGEDYSVYSVDVPDALLNGKPTANGWNFDNDALREAIADERVTASYWTKTDKGEDGETRTWDRISRFAAPPQ